MAAIRWIASVLLTLASLQGAHGGEPSAKSWQERIDKERKVEFDAQQAGILNSLLAYNGKCQINMHYDPARRCELTLRFVRDKKEILVLEGHFDSVFRPDETFLYFADFNPSASGCTLVAYELNTGRQVWRTKLKGIGDVSHSKYFNSINMEFARDVLCVRGYESFGDYVEIVDMKTGKTIANRVTEPSLPWYKKK